MKILSSRVSKASPGISVARTGTDVDISSAAGEVTAAGIVLGMDMRSSAEMKEEV